MRSYGRRHGVTSRVGGFLLVPGLLVLAAALSGCGGSGDGHAADPIGGPGPTVGPVVTGSPVETLPPGRPDPVVAWAGQGTVSLTTYGSSSCPDVPAGAERVGEQHVRVSLVQTGGPLCTADIAPTTRDVVLPDGVSDTAPVRLDIAGVALTLPARN